jgi:predicted alpha/beta-fold hydrolase
MKYSEEEVSFTSRGEICRGLFLKAESEQSWQPCVIMAHGLGGTIDSGLMPYARRFVDQGFSVLLFDYRHFGFSEGEPRQLIS